MIWFIAVITTVTFASIFILYSYFDGLHLQLRAKIEKQDQIIIDLCKVIDKNFLKLGNELNELKTKEE